MTDRAYLLQAFRLAARAGKATLSNPRVGALLVRDRRVVASAYHRSYGHDHAEVALLKHMSKKDCVNGTLYITLEPCVVWRGKQRGSCALAIIQRGIRTVVIGMKDPHPNVYGKGIAQLKKAGVIVQVVDMEKEFRKLNPHYIQRVERLRSAQGKKPFVLMKTAMSLDGKIAFSNRHLFLFSSKEDIRAVDRLRARSDAILIGGTTLLMDDPRLTVKSQQLQAWRIKNGYTEQPIKVVVGRRIHIPRSSRFLNEGTGTKIFFITSEMPKTTITYLEKMPGVAIYVQKRKHISLKKVLYILAQNFGVHSVLLEGGGSLNFSMLQEKLVDEIRVAIAPVVLGGMNTPTLIDGIGFHGTSIPKLFLLGQEKIRDMIVLRYRVLYASSYPH